MGLGVMMMMSFTLLVLVLRQSRRMPSSGDGASQVGGQGGRAQAKPSPAQDQKRPPCDAKYQIEMEGVCWQRSSSETCDGGAGFKINGKCYVPVLPDSGPPVVDP
jgi:hypothetical protein